MKSAAACGKKEKKNHFVFLGTLPRNVCMFTTLVEMRKKVRVDGFAINQSPYFGVPMRKNRLNLGGKGLVEYGDIQ